MRSIEKLVHVRLIKSHTVVFPITQLINRMLVRRLIIPLTTQATAQKSLRVYHAFVEYLILKSLFRALAVQAFGSEICRFKLRIPLAFLDSETRACSFTHVLICFGCSHSVESVIFDGML